MTDVKKKNILLLIPTFADEGGTQKMVAELGNLLAEKHNVFECSFDAFNEPHIFKNNNKVLSLQSKPGKGLGKLFGYYRKSNELRKLKNKYQIDVTISNLWSADLVNAISRTHEKKLSIGHVNIIGNFQNRKLLKWKGFAGSVYRRFDKVVAVNPRLQQELREVFNLNNGKVNCINNFVTLAVHEPVIVARPNRRKRLVNFGRLNAIKNHEALLKIFQKVKEQIDRVQLVIMGAGPQYEQLQSSSRQLGFSISNDPADDVDIVFTGFHPDPHSILCSSDLFVFTSISEGFGLVLVEALHAGLPVITSDCPTGGPHLIMQGKNNYRPDRQEPEATAFGFLMPVPNLKNDRTIHEWAKTILNLLSNDSHRKEITILAKKRALDFSKEKIKDQWFELIESL
jgi:glycosyltransferase involved in cell wall biosynthesis